MSDAGHEVGPSHFRARMLVENPGEIQMTLKLTMSIKQWEELRDQLASAHPSWLLSAAITDMMMAERKTFYPPELSHE